MSLLPKEDWKSYKRTLTVVHHGALGDFLLACPVFDGLYDACSDLRLNFCSKPEHLALLSEKPFFGFILSSDSRVLAPFYDENLWKTAHVPDIFQHTDGILVFGQKGSMAFRDRMAARVDKPVQWIQSFPTVQSNPLPVSRFLLEQVRQYGWNAKSCEPRLVPSKDELSAASDWFAERGLEADKTVVVHLGSGGRRKIWPLRKWWRLLVWLREAYGFQLLMTLGPADEYVAELAARAGRELEARLAAGLSISRLAAYLALPRLYIGNDSGVTHLAASVGTPVVAVFGPTKPEIWAPLGPHVQVVKDEWLDEEVLEMPAQSPSDEEPEAAVCIAVREALLQPRPKGIHAVADAFSGS